MTAVFLNHVEASVICAYIILIGKDCVPVEKQFISNRSIYCKTKQYATCKPILFVFKPINMNKTAPKIHSCTYLDLERRLSISFLFFRLFRHKILWTFLPVFQIAPKKRIHWGLQCVLCRLKLLTGGSLSPGSLSQLAF